MTQKDTLHTVQFFSCQFFGCETLQPLAECTKIQRLVFSIVKECLGKRLNLGGIIFKFTSAGLGYI